MTHHGDKKPLKPQADDQSHKPAKQIEETAGLASSTETAKRRSRVMDDDQANAIIISVIDALDDIHPNARLANVGTV
jgi:hypothetical protein